MGGIWNGFLLGTAKKETFLVDFVAKEMVMVTSFGSVLFTPFNMFGIFLNSLILISLDRSEWPRCLL